MIAQFQSGHRARFACLPVHIRRRRQRLAPSKGLATTCAGKRNPDAFEKKQNTRLFWGFGFRKRGRRPNNRASEAFRGSGKCRGPLCESAAPHTACIDTPLIALSEIRTQAQQRKRAIGRGYRFTMIIAFDSALAASIGHAFRVKLSAFR